MTASPRQPGGRLRSTKYIGETGVRCNPIAHHYGGDLIMQVCDAAVSIRCDFMERHEHLTCYPGLCKM